MRMILHRFLFVVVACLCFYFTLRSTSTTGTTQQQYTLEPQADSIHFVHVSKKTQESNKQSTTNGLVCQQQRQQQTNDNTMTTKRLALLRPLKHSWSRLVDAFQIILRPRSFGGLIVRDVTPPCRNLQFHVRANSYTLHEPLDFELGAPCKYATDYAYTPVTLQSVGAAQESKTTKEDAQQQGVLIQENLQQQQWWQWWLPRSSSTDDHYYYYPFNNNKKKYTINKRAFAGGSHGQVWKGVDQTNQALIFKRLHLERGLDILEAGLREVHFGQWLAQVDARGSLFTTYVDHFFRESSGSAAAATVELWIVFKDAGTSLRGLLYEAVGVGDFVVFQPSALWVEIRMSVSALQESTSLEQVPAADHHTHERNNMHVWAIGRKLMSQVLRSILQAAALLHANGIAHRDIKPGNVMCQPNFNVDDLLSGRYAEQEAIDALAMNCVLGDLSSAWDKYSDESLYTRRPSRLEQTDDYAPPEAIFGYLYNQTSTIIDPSFDSWSTGILALEMLLGTPNVFSVDQRTTAVLTHQMKKEGASDADIQRALYLAALSQFCIYNPTSTRHHGWPLRDDDPLPYPLHNYSMVKHTCTLHDFHRGLLARDPLGLGFDSSADTLLHLIWQLLNWDPNERMTASEALAHPYFTRVDTRPENLPNENTALESQMLDPRMDFNLSDTVDEYHCPKCQRIFDDWNSCLLHTVSPRALGSKVFSFWTNASYFI
jgi:serine/threonine protein kinase